MEGENVVAETVVDTATDASIVATTPAEGEQADAEQAEVTGESATPDGEDSTATPRKNKGVGKRINELVREREEARRDAEQKAAELEYWRQKAGELAPSDKPPTREQFDYDDEKYLAARVQYELRQELGKREQHTRQTAAQQAAQTKAIDFIARAEEFAAEHPDFKEVAIDNPLAYQFSPVLVDVISEVGPELAYYLGQEANFDEAMKFINLGQIRNPNAAKSAITKRWEQIKPKAQPERPNKSVTNAPKVPPRLDSSAGVQKDLSKMTFKEFCAYRDAEEAKKRR